MRKRPFGNVNVMLFLLLAAGVCAGQFCPLDGYTVSTIHAPFTVASCDLDGDGFLDLVTANADTDDLSIMLNNGDGTFGPAQLVAAGDEPVDVVCCDLDGDSDLDLIAANRHVSQVGVFINESTAGTLQLAPRAPYPVGLAPWGVRCLDLNGDSRGDIVTSNFTSESVSVLLNSGNGSFGSAINLPTGARGTFYIATCDLDGDMDLDVVVSNYVGMSITSFRNNQNGALTKIGTFPVGALLFPMGIACCDLNSDGYPDAATAVSGDNLVAVLFNDGTGRFDDPELPPKTAASGNQPFKLTCCNIDGDDDFDVLTANLGSDDVTVLRNEGDGTLAVQHSFPLGSNVGAAACAKFTINDSSEPPSRGDIAAAFGDGVEVFLNACLATGDGDADGDTDLRDMAYFLTCFGEPPESACQPFDLDPNQTIDLDDFATMIMFWDGPVAP